MWQLQQRALINNPAKTWRYLGSYSGLSAVAEAICDIEGYPTRTLFLNLYVDPFDSPEDSDLFQRFEHTGTQGFYVVERQVN